MIYYSAKISFVKANPVTCEICEMAMQYLDSMLSNNSTEEEIKQGLDQLCAYLPESVRGEVRNLLFFLIQRICIYFIL